MAGVVVDTQSTVDPQRSRDEISATSAAKEFPMDGIGPPEASQTPTAGHGRSRHDVPMTKTLSVDLTYDAPLEAVTAMLADPTFREQVCDAQKATSRTATSTGIPGQVDVVMTQATEGAPGFAQKLVGTEVKVERHETWTSPTAATLSIDAGFGGARITGTFALSEAGGRTTQAVRLSIEVRLPLVGGKLESLVSDLMSKAFAKEHKVGQKYLAQPM
jgi:uncharacterized protein YndB with AHSA1/START domain